MKIYLREIPETGLVSSEEVSPEPYELNTGEAKVVSPLSLSYRLFLDEQNLLFHFSLSCRIEFVCSRCLRSYELTLQKEGEVSVPVGKEKVVDMTDDIRQEVLLEYPMKPLCREDCKGICSVCGQNLNEGVCGH